MSMAIVVPAQCDKCEKHIGRGVTVCYVDEYGSVRCLCEPCDDDDTDAARLRGAVSSLVTLASDAFDEGVQDGEGRKVEDLDLTGRWMRSSARRRVLDILTDEVRAMLSDQA